MSSDNPHCPTQTLARRRWRSSLRGVWGNTHFVKFWLGETISLFGSQVTLVALPLTAVLVLHVNAEQLGLLRTVEWLPYIPFPLLLGVWVDRWKRRPLMIGTNIARAFLIGLVPLLSVVHLLQLPPLYLIAFCTGVCTVLFDLCWQSFVPRIVPKEDLIEANSKLATSAAAAEVGGPGIAGVLVQVLTAPIAVCVDSISFLLSVFSLLLIRIPEPVVERTNRGHWLKETAEGVRFTFRNPYIRTLTLQAAAWNFFFAILDTIFLLYALRELGFSPSLLGLIYATGAVGGLLGSALATLLMKRFHLGIVICATFTLGSVPFLLLSFVMGSRTVVLVVCVIVFFLVRTALGIYTVVSISLRQAITPHGMMGRVAASTRVLTYGATTLGALISGFLGERIGLRFSLLIAGCGFIVALLPIFFSPILRLRAIPSTEELLKDTR